MDRLKGMSREKLQSWSQQEFESIITKLKGVDPRTVEQDAMLFFLTDAYQQRWPGARPN